MPSLPPSLARELVAVNRTTGSHRVALRAAFSVMVPLLVLVFTGHTGWAAYASFGAFTSLYGRRSEHLVRLQMQASAAVMLVLTVPTGVAVGLLDAGWWMDVLVGMVIAATGTVVARAHSYHPGGPLFFIFAFGAIALMPHQHGDLLTALLVSGASALFSILVGTAGVLLDPRGLRGAWRERVGLTLDLQQNWQPAWMALGVLVAGTLAHLFRIGHPYWAMVAAVAPLSAPQVTTQVARGIHRTVGTTVGLVTAWVVLALHLAPVPAVLVVAVLQLLTEMWVGRNYAIAMLFITPMALLMGQIGVQRPIAGLLYDRGLETFIGSAVGIGIAVLGWAVRRRRLRLAARAAG